MIAELNQSDDPAKDWRKINELVAAVNAILGAAVIPSSAGSFKPAGPNRWLLDISTMVRRIDGIEYRVDQNESTRGTNYFPPPPPP